MVLTSEPPCRNVSGHPSPFWPLGAGSPGTLSALSTREEALSFSGANGRLQWCGREARPKLPIPRSTHAGGAASLQCYPAAPTTRCATAICGWCARRPRYIDPPFPLPAHPLGLSPSHLSSHSHSHSHTHTHTHANRHRAATLSISCPPSPSPLSHAVGRVSRGRGLRIALPRDKQRPAGSPRRWSLVDHPLPTLYLLVVLNTRHAHRIHLCKSIWTSYACMGAGVRGRQAR